MDVLPYHGATGTVAACGRGRGPINATVRIDGGAIVTVPRGNLIPEPLQ